MQEQPSSDSFYDSDYEGGAEATTTTATAGVEFERAHMNDSRDADDADDADGDGDEVDGEWGEPRFSTIRVWYMW